MAPSPAGFQKVASMLFTSATTGAPKAEPRGPTGKRSSSAPPVPTRSSAARAGCAARQDARARPIARRRNRRTPLERNRSMGSRMVRIPLEVVEALFFHEHHHAAEGGAHARSVDVVDVHAARDRQLIVGLHVPVED